MTIDKITGTDPVPQNPPTAAVEAEQEQRRRDLNLVDPSPRSQK